MNRRRLPGKLFQVLPDPTGTRLAVEVRTENPRQVHFCVLSLPELAPVADVFEGPEAYWCSLLAHWPEGLLLGGYHPTDMPIAGGLYLYSGDGAQRWARPDLALAHYLPAGPLARAVGGPWQRLDPSTGRTLATLSPEEARAALATDPLPLPADDLPLHYGPEDADYPALGQAFAARTGQPPPDQLSILQDDWVSVVGVGPVGAGTLWVIPRQGGAPLSYPTHSPHAYRRVGPWLVFAPESTDIAALDLRAFRL